MIVELADEVWGAYPAPAKRLKPAWERRAVGRAVSFIARADHVGSLLRPRAERERKTDAKHKALPRQTTSAASSARRRSRARASPQGRDHGRAHREDHEIERTIKKQEEVGLQSITDGEFRRSWWHLDFLWGLDGVEKHVMDTGIAFAAVTTRNEGVKVTGKLGFSLIR